MQFDEYQQQSRTTALYPELGSNFVYPTLGLVGEAGEVAEKVKKLIRDKAIHAPRGLTLTETAELKKELGDVLWYLSQIASELGLDLSDVATANLAKIQSRQQRNEIHGDGDNR